MWWRYLRIEIAAEFAEAQRSHVDLAALTDAVLWQRAEHRKARRRDRYDTHRQYADEWYESQAARARVNSALARADPVRYGSARAKVLRAADWRRAIKSVGLVCPECSKPVVPRKRMGRVPKFCSALCNRRAAGRAYWRRKHPPRTR